jgi:phosphatidylglycerophosphate synthase
MSKKETRRAARQAFPKAGGSPKVGTGRRTKGSRTVSRSSGSARSRSAARPALRPPTLKRAAIQGAILAALYLIVIRFVWREQGTTTATYVIFPLAGFFVYTGLAYAIDRFTYQRRLRKLKGPPK